MLGELFHFWISDCKVRIISMSKAFKDFGLLRMVLTEFWWYSKITGEVTFDEENGLRRFLRTLFCRKIVERNICCKFIKYSAGKIKFYPCSFLSRNSVKRFSICNIISSLSQERANKLSWVLILFFHKKKQIWGVGWKSEIERIKILTLIHAYRQYFICFWNIEMTKKSVE